jgi:hypothetical protein
MGSLQMPVNQGCQIFLGTTYQIKKNVPNDLQIYKVAIKYTIWPKSRLNGHLKYQHLPLQDLPKFTHN